MEVEITAESPQTLSPIEVDWEALEQFLGNPERADTTLNLAQTEGFLFAVACCPQDVDAAEWLPVVLGDAKAANDEDDVIVPNLQALFEEIAVQVKGGAYQLPGRFCFSWDPEERSAFEQWCEGVLLADEWLESRWMDALSQAAHRDPTSYDKLSQDLDDTVGLLKVLVDVDAALEVLERESAAEVDDFRQQIRDSYEVIDEYLVSYMRAGNGLSVYYHSDPQVRQAPKIGRNDSCPCGSGKKYKKCCMS